MSSDKGLAETLRIENVILTVRGQRVILDSDLAAIYGVSTKSLNKAIRRNADRFPSDFVFRLTAEEMKPPCGKPRGIHRHWPMLSGPTERLRKEPGVLLLLPSIRADAASRGVSTLNE